jgi:hypothetical protein
VTTAKIAILVSFRSNFLLVSSISTDHRGPREGAAKTTLRRAPHNVRVTSRRIGTRPTGPTSGNSARICGSALHARLSPWNITLKIVCPFVHSEPYRRSSARKPQGHRHRARTVLSAGSSAARPRPNSSAQEGSLLGVCSRIANISRNLIPRAS